MRCRLAVMVSLIVAATALPALPAPAPAGPPVPLGARAAEGADFGALRGMGATAVKLVANWSEIEARAGTLQWDVLDGAVSAARAAGLRIVLVLSYTPRWASPATGAELSDPSIYARQPPKRVGDWDAFVTAAVSRYKDQVRDWQIWTARGLPLFRGTTRQYLDLLSSARVIIKVNDPLARIILSTPFGLDLTDLRRMVTDAADDFDVISLAPRGIPPDTLLRALGTIRERVLSRTPKSLWIEWDPYSYGQRATWPGQLVKLQAVAKAFGVEYLFWTDATAITQVVLGALAGLLGRKPYAGYVTRQRALLLVFGDADPSVVAWSAEGEVSVMVEGDQIKAFGPTGDPRPVVTDGEKRTVTLGTDPLVLTGIASAVAGEARQAAQSGYPLLPVATDFSQAAEISARLGKTNVERGLYNAPYRARNDATTVIDVDGAEAVRADSAVERIYVRFDVDDTFLYFVDGRATVEITVEVRGASAPDTLGFNLWYDSMSGYRFTPWQKVEASQGWVTYAFRLTDAAFANTWGWDFAINAAGNRSEDLVVRSVTVRKVAP